MSHPERDESVTKHPVPYVTVEVRGSHREIGCAVGEAAREQIVSAVGWYADNFRAMAGFDFSEAEYLVTGYLAFARRWLPQYVEELEGMADAAGVTLEALCVPNCGEEFTWRAPGRPLSVESLRPAPACTSVALAVDGRHIVGHNMDWYAVDLDKNVLFDVTNPSGVRFLTLCGVPYLPAIGFNSAGIGYIGNAVCANDERIGVPNVLVRRWVLEATDIAEGCRRAAHPARARGSTHVFADADGRLVTAETSATAASIRESAELLVHTNHFMHEDMLQFEGYGGSGEVNSRERLDRAVEILSTGIASGADPLQLVMDTMRDHAHAPRGICNHPNGHAAPTDGMTVGSMVCDMDEGRLFVCAGPPCTGEYTEYAL